MLGVWKIADKLKEFMLDERKAKKLVFKLHIIRTSDNLFKVSFIELDDKEKEIYLDEIEILPGDSLTVTGIEFPLEINISAT